MSQAIRTATARTSNNDAVQAIGGMIGLFGEIGAGIAKNLIEARTEELVAEANYRQALKDWEERGVRLQRLVKGWMAIGALCVFSALAIMIVGTVMGTISDTGGYAALALLVVGVLSAYHSIGLEMGEYRNHPYTKPVRQSV